MTAMEEIIETYGRETWDLVLTVYVNFYYSELDIIHLCSRWVPRRSDLLEKSFLLRHAADEIKHAELFREGVEQLGMAWDGFDHERYRIADIRERFDKLFRTEDELEVLIGLNLYAEGVLALEELEQLGKHKPEYFFQFDRIAREERAHVAFGVTVAKRMIAESEDNRRRALGHCKWYEEHMDRYLGGELSQRIRWASSRGFVSPDYVERTRQRFRSTMDKLHIPEA